jgi:regulator of protease activity HflC (stomatin/prohibitin superfamily)
MQNRMLYVLLALVAVILIVRASVFTVAEGELAIKSIGGEIVDSNYKPGLHFRIPLVNEVSRYDARILTQMYPAEHFLTREQEQLNVDFYVKWRILNLRRFYEATGGTEEVANARLGETVKDSIKSVVTQRTLQQVITAERAEFTGAMMKTARPLAEQLGVELVDVRITKIDLPQQVQDSVFDRMRASFKAQAAKLRAEQGADRNSGRRGAPGGADSRTGRCVGERGVRPVVLEECGVLQLLSQHGILPGGRWYARRHVGDRAGQCLLQVFQQTATATPTALNP